MDARTKEIQKVTIWGAVCNLLLSALKLFAGIVGSSSAMVADAVHSLSDLASDVVIVIFSRISSKGKDKSHDYGHGKFETLAVLCVCLILAVVGAKMMQSSIAKIRLLLSGEQLAVPGAIALWMALVSIVVKEVLYQWTAKVGKKVDSPAVVANAWHHRTDALSSVGALLGIGGAIVLGGKWLILDPLTGVIISIFIIVIAVRMALPALNSLTDASLSDEEEEKITSLISSVKGVENIHDLKTRQCGSYFDVDAHVVVNPDLTVLKAHEITVEIEDRLRDKYGKELQINIHVEPSIDSK